MTEIVELAHFGTVTDADEECPFEHEFDPIVVENDFCGLGTTLGTRMSNAHSTHIYSRSAKAKGKNCNLLTERYGPDYTTLTAILDPRLRAGADRITHVNVSFNKRTLVEKGSIAWEDKHDYQRMGPYTYAVTCAAHHLVPAQDSLKGSPILKWMCKQGETQKFKNGKATVTATPGKVWGNVGYDVNGHENGIFLPGCYAVSETGSGHWRPSRADSDEEEPLIIPQNQVSIDSFGETFRNDLASGAKTLDAQPMLTGDVWYDASETSPSAAYVLAAVRRCKGQFHDSHPDYNRLVRRKLAEISDSYQGWADKQLEPQGCDKCKSLKEKHDIKDQLPPPYGIVTRMNNLSNNFGRYLNGSIWTLTIYTSDYGKEYADHLAVEDWKDKMPQSD